jgi:hypothetical protein
LEAIKPKTLRCAGGESQPRRRSGALKWKKLVALNKLAQVHQPAQFFGRRRNADSHDCVTGLGRGQEMADRADSANSWGDARHFGERPAFAEFLEPTKFDDVKFCVRNLTGVIQEDANFGVSLDAGYRVNDDASSHWDLD